MLIGTEISYNVKNQEHNLSVKEQWIQSYKPFLQERDEIVLGFQTVIIVQRDYKATQNEEKINEEIRVNYEEVIIKYRIFEGIVVVCNNKNCKNAA